MTTETLDHRTAERLLREALPPDDAPPGYGGVAKLLQAARAEARAESSARTGETITAMVAVIEANPPSAPAVRPVRATRRRPRRIAAVVVSSAALALFGGMTAAGALPAAAQDHVASVLAKVGIDVPRGDGSSGRSTVADDEGPAGKDSYGATHPDNHGRCVSGVAGTGGTAVRDVARSDCGKPATAGPKPGRTNNGNGPRDGTPPGPAKPDNEHPTHPAHPSQSSSGGHGNSGGNAGGNGIGNNSSSAPGQTKTK
jgi:hypothetical protein